MRRFAKSRGRPSGVCSWTIARRHSWWTSCEIAATSPDGRLCLDEVGHPRNLPLRLSAGVLSLDADEQLFVEHGKDPLEHWDRGDVITSFRP